MRAVSRIATPLAARGGGGDVIRPVGGYTYGLLFEDARAWHPEAAVRRVRFASLIVTYRCNARCRMCHTWKHPSEPAEEIGPEVFARLPYMDTVNITGGEPFLRDDLEEIVRVVQARSRRIVISSNGYLTERIVRLFERFSRLGIRVSLEGLPRSNDQLRGMQDGFDHGLRTLLRLKSMGIKDIGFGITVSDANAGDLVDLYHLSRLMGVEFASAALHNSFYFHKMDNTISKPEFVAECFDRFIEELLRSPRPKDWFRAYFNHGLVNYIQGGQRLLPCRMGRDAFFLDPFGRVLPCNVLDEPMGDLRREDFETIWTSPRAEEVRALAGHCGKDCWMMGSVAEPMKKNLLAVSRWILRNKFLPRRRETPPQ